MNFMIKRRETIPFILDFAEISLSANQAPILRELWSFGNYGIPQYFPHYFNDIMRWFSEIIATRTNDVDRARMG